MTNKTISSMVSLQALEEYLQNGRYFKDATLEALMMEWFSATTRMRSKQLGPDLKRSIVGVIGELGLRGKSIPDQAMAQMQDAAFEALASLDPATRERLVGKMIDTFSTPGTSARKPH